MKTTEALGNVLLVLITLVISIVFWYVGGVAFWTSMAIGFGTFFVVYGLITFGVIIAAAYEG